MEMPPVFCVLYSIHYLLYEAASRKAGIFQNNLHYTAFIIQPQRARVLCKKLLETLNFEKMVASEAKDCYYLGFGILSLVCGSMLCEGRKSPAKRKNPFTIH
jgi:hypothetical protein